MTKQPPFPPGSIIGPAHLMNVRDESTGEMSVLKPTPKATEPSKTVQKRPIKQQIFQENEILRVIAELKLDPESLPKFVPGKRWVKSAVREKLGFSISVFDKAWERLRRDGRIKES